MLFNIELISFRKMNKSSLSLSYLRFVMNDIVENSAYLQIKEKNKHYLIDLDLVFVDFLVGNKIVDTLFYN